MKPGPPPGGPANLHATCVAIGPAGILIQGPSGSGKSSLALMLIDGGARLVADDQVWVTARDGRLAARPPPEIAGRIELRGFGLIPLPHAPEAQLDLAVTLHPGTGPLPDRLPERTDCTLLGVRLRRLDLVSGDPAAAAKIRLMLTVPPFCG